MFRNTIPATEPEPVVTPPADLIPISQIALDLPEPSLGWLNELDRRGISVLTDDIGRKAISRADARLLIAEQAENEARAREAAERIERQAIEADRVWRAQLLPGVPWYQIPPESTPANAMLVAARDEGPRSPLLDFLDNPDNGTVFHPVQSGGDEW